MHKVQLTEFVQYVSVCMRDETSPVGEATVGGWRGWSRVTTPPRRQVHGLCVPLSSFNEFNRVLKPPDPARPPRAQRPTTWETHNLGSFSISAGLQASSLTLLCPSFFIFPLLCLWSLHWFSFSERRQWTNLSETSALLYTLSKTHFWIWAYIIAPKTWLYNIQQCRFAKKKKNSQRDKTKESLNKSHFFSAKTPLTHTLSSHHQTGQLHLYFTLTCTFKYFCAKLWSLKTKVIISVQDKLRCAHREGLQTLRGKILTKFKVLSRLNTPSISRNLVL